MNKLREEQMIASMTRIICFYIISISTLISQDIKPVQLDAITQLKSGVLIVRLDMKKNVEETYLEILQNPNTAAKQYKLVSERLDSLKSERIRYKENVISRFHDKYNFSDYCFIENQYMDQFNSGDTSALIDWEESFDTQKSNGNYFFLVKGDSDTHWLICDRNFKLIKAPFPSSHDLGLIRLFDFLAKKDAFNKKNLTKVFGKMQTRLERYYEKAKGGK